MIQANFLAERERWWVARHRKMIIERILHGLKNGLLMLAFFIIFTIFAWSATQMDPPATSANWPFYPWVWTAAMALVAVSSFIAGVCFLFGTLDELFYDKLNPRRITGKRR